jgi:hypothetical protein
VVPVVLLLIVARVSRQLLSCAVASAARSLNSKCLSLLVPFLLLCNACGVVGVFPLGSSIPWSHFVAAIPRRNTNRWIVVHSDPYPTSTGAQLVKLWSLVSRGRWLWSSK